MLIVLLENGHRHLNSVCVIIGVMDSWKCQCASGPGVFIIYLCNELFVQVFNLDLDKYPPAALLATRRCICSSMQDCEIGYTSLFSCSHFKFWRLCLYDITVR